MSEIREPILTPDQPISTHNQDHLGRGEFAARLATQLMHYRDDRCLVVAFYAPWGAGKSSLLNLLAIELAKATGRPELSPIVIRFNPWNFSSLNSLLSMFFRELRAGAGRSDSKLAKNVQKSLHALSIVLAAGEMSPMGGSSLGALSRLLKRGSEALENKSESLIEVKERINEELRQLNRRIFVLIDDIDRLDQESMRFMFRLIRLNADFDRMTYVLAFDRDVVASVLAQEQGVSDNAYLEKIVQVGFDIPPAEPGKLKGLFSQALSNIDFLADMDEENIIRWIDLETGGLNKLLRTPRDVVRYINGLAVNGGIVSEEVNPVDLAAIEAIRTFAPEFYAFIRNNRDIVVGPTGGSFGLGNQPTREFHRLQLDEASSLDDPELKIPIREICRQLFPETESLYDNSIFGSGSYDAWRQAKRICTVDYFPRYFYLRPSEQEVTQAEFDAIVGDAGNHTQLMSIIKELVDTGKIDNFLGRLEDAAAKLAEERSEEFVLALFDLGDEIEAGLRPENGFLRMAGVVHKLLVRLTEPARGNIVLKAAATASSLGALVYFTRFYSRHSRLERQFLDEAKWNEVIGRLVTRISSAAEDMTLSQSPHLGILLYRWKEWDTPEDSRTFVARLTRSDDGILDFLQGVLAQQSTPVGNYASRRGWYLPIDTVSEFIDPEILVEPLQRIKRERWDDITDMQRAAIDAFFEARGSSCPSP